MNSCLNCSKDTNNPRFCSRSCSASYSNKQVPKRKRKTLCSKTNCQSITKDYRSTLCLEHHEERIKSSYASKMNTTLEEYINKDSVKRLHKSSKFVHIRQLGRYHNKHLLSLPCANCGYDKHVELCHIKPISSFALTATIGEINSPDNLIQLCPNCHWEFDNISSPGQNPTAITSLEEKGFMH